MTILEDIKNNAIETLHLDDVPKEYFASTTEFVEAMQGNTSITKVFFEKDFIACLGGADRKAVVAAVSQLQNVETVILKDSILMVGICVTDLVTKAKKLQSLSMEHCVLQGLSEDFELLEGALKANSSVKDLTIGKCTVTGDDVDLQGTLGSLSINVSIAT